MNFLFFWRLCWWSLTEVYPVDIHWGYPCWCWPRLPFGTNSPRITLLDHHNFIRVHNACCRKSGTRRALNLYSALAIKKRSVCYSFSVCIIRKRFVQLYFATALLRQMFHFSCNRRKTPHSCHSGYFKIYTQMAVGSSYNSNLPSINTSDFYHFMSVPTNDVNRIWLENQTNLSTLSR